jgi:hypothetical protein
MGGEPALNQRFLYFLCASVFYYFFAFLINSSNSSKSSGSGALNRDLSLVRG